MKMNALNLALASALTLTSTAGFAYQIETKGGYVNHDVDAPVDLDVDSYQLGAKLYMNPVTVGAGVPHEEAAFLSRASNAAINYSNLSVEDQDVDSLGVSGEYYFPQSDLYASGSFSSIGNDVSTDDVNLYEANIGLNVAPGALVTAGVFVADPDNGDRETDAKVTGKYVGNAGMNKFNVEGGAIFNDADSTYAAADYYIDPTMSVGLTYNNQYVETIASSNIYSLLQEDQVGIRAKKYFTPQLAVGVNYSQGDIDGLDVDNFGIDFTGRF